MNNSKKMVVVSNRLPVTLDEGPDGIEAHPSQGGLVTALLPVFRETGGHWVGWPGTDYDERVAEVLRSECAPDYALEPVFLSAKDRALFYHGCANEVIWPLFHDLQSRCRFDPSFWASYRAVNSKFADAVQLVAEDDDFLWVHDYHLMLLGRTLRDRGTRSTIAYFHHIPFPSPDIFSKLPWRRDILEALLSFTMVGFQADRDRRNFVACVRHELGDARVHAADGCFEVHAHELSTRIGTFPISIDFKAFSDAARDTNVDRHYRDLKWGTDGRQLIVGIDRLDYTKGIPERLLGYSAFLKQHPEFRRKVNFVQVVVPSREEIQNYSELRTCIERRISEINGEFGTPDWSPVMYMHRSLTTEELLALYRAADVMLVTPLKDGMNLVAKEYCAANNDESGVLILSEFAGAAAELKGGALLVNPYDYQGISTAIVQGLNMAESAKKPRMRAMRELIRRNDVFHWCKCFRDAASRSSSRALPSPALAQVKGFATAV